MATFEELWQLLYEHGSTNYYKHDCAQIWEGLTPKQQQELYDKISTRIHKNSYVAYNPVEAIHDNMPRKRTLYRQTLTYGEYYSIYHTTEAKDGWQTDKDEEGKLIYVKQ